MQWQNQKSYTELLAKEMKWSIVYAKIYEGWTDQLTSYKEDSKQYSKEYDQAKQLFLSKIKLTKEDKNKINYRVTKMKSFFRNVRENEDIKALKKIVSKIQKQSTFLEFREYGLNRTYDFCNLTYGMYNLMLFLNRTLEIFTEYEGFREASYPLEKLEYGIRPFYRALGYYVDIKTEQM